MKPEPAPAGGWHSTNTPRIAPLPVTELNLPWRTVLRLARGWMTRRIGSARLPDVFLLLLHHRRLFMPWLRFASKLMPYGTLDRRDTELVILRVGWNCRCRYEWGQHVRIGLREGLTGDDIARVAEGPQAEGWTPRRAALLQATDELHRNRIIAPDTWQRLEAHFDAAQCIEITMLIGHYEMLAGLLNSVGLPLEEETERQIASSTSRT